MCHFLEMLHLLRSGFFVKGPASVDIELSNRCNLKCKMCWFHGESGVGDRYLNSEMTTAEIFGLADQLASYRPRIYLGGGEPFIREDILAILDHLKSHGLSVALTTNGTLLDQEKIQKVVDLGIDVLNFSIDGHEDLHDAMRGKGCFRKAISSIKAIAERKTEKSLKKPSLVVNITITPSVVGHLQKIIRSIRRATDDGVDFYRIHHLWFIFPAELRVHHAAIQKYLSRGAPGARAHLIDFSQQIDYRALADEISQIKNDKRIKSFPDLRDEEIVRFYSGDYRVKKRCMASFRTAVIKPNGDVKFCPDEWIDDYILGNIREDHFENIWNNERARRFRSVIFRKKSFPGCKRCSWMYSF